jgi:4-oxalocrotonate tautomerase
MEVKRRCLKDLRLLRSGAVCCIITIPVNFYAIREFQITQGATRDQKAQLVKEVTASLVNILGKKPEHTHIVIQEIADEDWGFSGLLTDDCKKQQASPPPTVTS